MTRAEDKQAHVRVTQKDRMGLVIFLQNNVLQYITSLIFINNS